MAEAAQGSAAMAQWTAAQGSAMAEASVRVLLVVEQLRRSVPGGIGAYTRGLLDGLAQLAGEGEGVDLTLLASRPPRSGADPVAALGPRVVTSPVPGRLLTRAWDHGLLHAPEGFDVVHSVSLAVPPLRRGSQSHQVVTVHDVAWRVHPEATTRRGRRWHEAALRRVDRSGASLVTPSRLVAADLGAAGIDPERVTVVHSGADHLPPGDPAATEHLLGRLGVSQSFLLSVGTLEPRKNLVRLVRAYTRVRRVAARALALAGGGTRRMGPVTGGGGSARGSGLRRRGGSRRVGRALPTRPCFRLRALGRGLRDATDRGHGCRDAHCRVGGCPERPRPRRS